MRLIHYSKEPLGLLEDVEADTPYAAAIGKPHGLWVSVEGEDDWKTWCEGESFHLEHLAVAQEIVLKPGAKILKVEDDVEFVALNKRFGMEDTIVRSVYSRVTINWRAVAKHYDGVIIAPYNWGRRLDPFFAWYYGWDCASGCIWRPSEAIAEVKQLAAS